MAIDLGALSFGHAPQRMRRVHAGLVLLATALLGACAALPPGRDFPKPTSAALAHPEETRLGAQFTAAARKHDGYSGFRILSVGADGFVTRLQMIDAAERTLDLQYYIFRADETGRMLSDALVRAADRGVRVRVLVDDGETVHGDEQVLALNVHPGIETRVFNPFKYRGHIHALRAIEYLLNHRRLDYRMHNKLLVVDNAVALIGGRNIGNQYFQIDPQSQFADDDVFSAGPIAAKLSATFDEYWNSALAIPAQAIERTEREAARAAAERARAAQQVKQLNESGIDYVARAASGEPYAGMVSGRLPLVWAPAEVLCDSPDKKDGEKRARAGHLMTRAVAKTAAMVQSEFILVTPYLIPAPDEMRIVEDLRQREVRVRILTNSLVSTTDIVAHSGYMHFRVPLLEDGVQLYEVRALLGNSKGSGQTPNISRYGNYGLHGKLFVFDRQKMFIGSMNFDERSRHLNTEVGLIIDSEELSKQTAARFEAMVEPDNAYIISLRESRDGKRKTVVWDTKEQGQPREYTREPARSMWQRLRVRFLSLLPLEKEL